MTPYREVGDTLHTALGRVVLHWLREPLAENVVIVELRLHSFFINYSKIEKTF